MTEDAFRRKLVTELAGAERFNVWIRLDDDFVQGYADPDGISESGIHVAGYPDRGGADDVVWADVFSVEARVGDRHVAFLDSIPTDLGTALRRFCERGPASLATAQTACRIWVNQADELTDVVSDLRSDDVDALRELAIGALHDEFGAARGLLLALGKTGGPRDALAIGDAVCEIGMSTDHPWRWRWGLEALRLLGTRDAHMQIQRISMQSLNPPTITAAREKLLHIAGDLKVPVWEVQDELVPSCGLDVQGGVDLSYGSRRFDLQLDNELKPILLERPGHERHRDLPNPGPDDDTDAAAGSRAAWSVVREQLLEAVPVQVHRFEEALAQQTRWDGKQWQRVVRRHPLLMHLVPRAVWGTYSKGGRKLLDTFRLSADDLTLSGPDDEPFELDINLPVGLPHPSEIRQEVRDAWGEVLADYEVVTMCPQIDRPIYRPDPDRKKESGIDLDIHVPGDWALTLLHRHGWSEHEGWGTYLQKVFRNRDVKAVLRYRKEEHPEGIVLEHVYWERYLGFPQTHFQLRDVSEVPYSETLYELEQLRMPQETGGWAAVL